MFNRFILCSVILSMVSCANLSRTQKKDLAEWEGKGVVEHVKDPSTASMLNILPGIGDFYNGDTGLGVVNLMLWPMSVFWAPIGAGEGAKVKNWEATKVKLDGFEERRKRAIAKVEKLHENKEIDEITKTKVLRKIASIEIEELGDEIKFKETGVLLKEKK